ncbi:MAG TPA: tyrosine-type recombinase/integrase [Pirellulales bacterium]|jgi:site-specific recombinase XerC
MPQSTAKAKSSKPAKPYAEFPLFAHATKRWAKKIRGKLHYFGAWDNPDAALDKYLREKDDLHAGRKPRQTADSLTVDALANLFLTNKRHLVDTGEIKARTFAEYLKTCEVVVERFGRGRIVVDLQPDDFESLRKALARVNGPVRLGNEIQRVRGMFKYAFEQGLIERPIRYGQAFQKPSRRIVRQARVDAGPKLFAADDIRRIIATASAPLKAMVLLGINCGFGNTDVAALPHSAVELEHGWVNFPRPKTAIQRRAPLWSETVEALRTAIAERPAHGCDDDAKLVFITKHGNRWVRFNYVDGNKEAAIKAKAVHIDAVGLEVKKVLTSLNLNRLGLGFYALRHTFQTIGEGAHDPAAVQFIMGHAPANSDMADVYREAMGDERLKRVTDHVHDWLFPKPKKSKKSPTAGKRSRKSPKKVNAR